MSSLASYPDSPEESFAMEDEKLSWSKRSKPTVSCRAWLVHCFLLTLSVLAGALVANTQPRQVVCRPQSYTTPAPSIANTHQYVDHGEKAHAGHDHNHANEDTKVKSKGRLPFELPVFGPDSSSDGKDAQYESVRFVGNPDSQSPYKGPPTAAVDAAWDALWAANMVIPKDMYELSAPEFPNAAVTTNASSVQGPDHYFATFEVTHQLHCLYTLFRASYVDYYEPERRFLMNNPTKYHARLDHCTDILRQKLMCDSDAGVATYNWVKGNDRPVSNYNVQHRCRKHQVLLDWSENYAATGALFSRGKNVVDLETDP